MCMRKNIHVPQRGGQRTTFPDSYPLGYLVTPEAVLLKAKTDLDRMFVGGGKHGEGLGKGWWERAPGQKQQQLWQREKGASK